MGKSFVLRDSAGTAVGCLMQGMDALHLSFRGGRESDEIALLTGDGTWKKRRVGQQTDGGGWLLEMCDAAGALMLRDGEIMADSGTEMRLRFVTEKRNTVSVKQTARQTVQETAVKRQERAAPRENDGQAGLPERRWPPPPCFEAASYCEGKWTL